VIYRILAGILFYALLPLCWLFLGAFMFMAPARFAGFIDENVVALPHARRPPLAMTLAIRAAGAGLIAFAIRFALNLAALFQG